MNHQNNRRASPWTRYVVFLGLMLAIYFFSSAPVTKNAVIRQNQAAPIQKECPVCENSSDSNAKSRTSSSSSSAKNSQGPLFIKVGGVPKEGIGSTLGFLKRGANVAAVNDGVFTLSRTAQMMDYRVSELVNRGKERDIPADARICSLAEILLDKPGAGPFQARMDRALVRLDEYYQACEDYCNEVTEEHPNSKFYMDEIEDCDVVIIDDHRAKSSMWTKCNMRWWQSVLNEFGRKEEHAIAIHYRWGDMFKVAQDSPKWLHNMTAVATIVDQLRAQDPSLNVKVYFKSSKEQESVEVKRDMLKPLKMPFEIVEAEDDMTELAMMSGASHMILNAGAFSRAAAAASFTAKVWFNGFAPEAFKELAKPYMCNYQTHEGCDGIKL